MNISYIRLLQSIESFASAHLQVQKFASDFPAQMPNFATTDEAYPILFVSPTTSIFDINSTVFEVDVYCFDIIQKDRENINTILSDTNLILSDLSRWFMDGDIVGIDLISSSATPIDNALLDYAAGWVMKIVFEVSTYGICEIPFDEAPIIISEVNDIVYSKWLTCETLEDCPVIVDIQNQLSGLTGEYLSLSGGTVTGNTIFTNGLTANTISATTYYNLPIENITPDSYLGLRLKPTDPSNNGFYINKSANQSVGYYVRNTDNVGNGAVSAIYVGGTGGLYDNYASLFHANNGFYIPYLRNNNGLVTNNDFFFVGWKGSSFDFRTGGNTFGSETSKFKISSGGTLNIGIQPSLDNTITDILGRKSDGTIIRIDKSTLTGSTPNLQDVTTAGNITTNSISVTEDGKFNVITQFGDNPSSSIAVSIYDDGGTGSILIRNNNVEDKLSTIRGADGEYESNFKLPTKIDGDYTFATLDDISGATGNQNLQQVTDIGNVTTNPIIVEYSGNIKSSMVSDVFESYFYSQYDGNYASIGTNEFGSIITTSDIIGSSQLSSVSLNISNAEYGMSLEQGKLSLESVVDQPFISMDGISGSTNITTNLLSNARQQALPDKDGIFAMLSDISGFTGNTLQVVTNNGNTTTNSIRWNTLVDASYSIASNKGLTIVDENNVFTSNYYNSIINYQNGSNVKNIDAGSISNNQSYIFPDKSVGNYTIATTSDLTDKFTTGGTFNSSAGTITFNTNSGATYTVTGLTTEVFTLISDGIAGTAVTGSTNQTRVLVKSYLIPANTFKVGDIMEFWAFGSKVGTNTAWYVGCSKNTSNTLAGSTELVRSYSNNAGIIYLPLQRVVNFPTASTLKVSNQTNTLEGATGVIQSTITFDTTIDNYLLFTVTPVIGGTADLMNIERVLITKSKYKTTI